MKKSSKFIFRVLSLVLALMVVLSCAVTSFAESIEDVPYTTYTYWEGYDNKTPVKTKATHKALGTVEGNLLGIGAFTELQHMVSHDGLLYILDSGNSRIVVLDNNYAVKEQITGFDYEGERMEFKGAMGIFADESGLYIADTLNKRLLCTKNGEIFKIITKPDDPTIPETFDFAPTKLVRDDNGYIYLLCQGSYYGMMVFSETYEFFGFFGANNVTTSFSNALKDLVTSLFETEEKHNASVKQLPFSLIDICIDSEGFVTGLTGTSVGQLKRFGFSGTNILIKNSEFASTSSNSFNFADYPVSFVNMLSKYRVSLTSSFCALTADNNGYYYAVDGTHGRIFMYDTACNILSVFGGGKQKGDQLGTFISPSSVCVYGDDLLVSDFSTGKITRFSMTEYGKLLTTANTLTVKSKYEDAKPYWQEIHAQDKNCQLAYRGLAKAALKEKNYDSAMAYAKSGLDREIYAQAFEQARNNFISDNFWWIAIVAVMAVALLVVFVVQSRKRNLVLIKNEKLRVALRTTVHPFESMENIKIKKMGSVVIATVFMLLFYVATILAELKGGFMFKINNLSNFNAILPLIGTVGIVILWTVANWLICILFEGKGNIKDIYCASCYCLLPLIVYNFAYIILSNVMIPSANSPFELFSTICYLLTAVLLLLMITVIHEFSFFKAIGTAIATVIVMAIVAFIVFSMLTLWQEILGFIFSVFNEVTLR
ncbi:MAG: hypothetical protein E7562_02075 [Ruminococcaceae bacterium]|nr:hypothetical protein [Oscillospiraceae bacterium]